MRSCLWVWVVLWVALVTTGCTASEAERLARSDQGLAEVQLDTKSITAFTVTSVVIESATTSQEIFFNPVTGTFDGSVLLDAGPQTLIARAFAGTQLVGESNPTAVEIEPGVVTRVVLRIRDVTAPPPPIFGPIFDSLVHPTTTEAGDTVTFAISVIAPSGSPVNYEWIAIGCPDSVFSSPTSPVTTWSKPTPGGCTIKVTANSNGFDVVQAFAITVFPAGAATGAADVTTVFVTAPVVDLTFFDLGCFVGPGTNASCSGTARSPIAQAYSSNVQFWGNSAPGTFEVFDSCGGRFGFAQRDVSVRAGHWLPPVGGGLCIITARAVNGDGVVGTRSAAILTRPGTPATAQPPVIFAQAGPGLLDCQFSSLEGVHECGGITPNTPIFVFGQVNWQDGHPGTLTITDDCSGDYPAPSNAFNFGGTWNPEGVNVFCTLTVNAISLEGDAQSASARYVLLP